MQIISSEHVAFYKIYFFLKCESTKVTIEKGSYKQID